MKRIQSACIEKTLHFQLKEDLEHNRAAAAVKQEVAAYKETLNRHNTAYRIVEEHTEPDDSIILKIKMQYNGVPVGDYLS